VEAKECLSVKGCKIYAVSMSHFSIDSRFGRLMEAQSKSVAVPSHWILSIPDFAMSLQNFSV
jgi:hypothetical protein